MIESSVPRTPEEIRKGLDYSFHSCDPERYRQAHRDRREGFIKTLSGERTVLTSQLSTRSYQATARFILDSCFPLSMAEIRVDAEFSTMSFLGSILGRIAKGEELRGEQWAAFHLLQKRFEVNRRIFDCYSPSINKVGDRFSDLTLYGMLSNVLIMLFLRTRRFTYLNSALKINDLIVTSGWQISDTVPVHQCLALEKMIMEELHAL